MALAFVALPVSCWLSECWRRNNTYQNKLQLFTRGHLCFWELHTLHTVGQVHERTPSPLHIPLLHSSCINSVKDTYEKMKTTDSLTWTTVAYYWSEEYTSICRINNFLIGRRPHSKQSSQVQFSSPNWTVWHISLTTSKNTCYLLLTNKSGKHAKS